MYPGGSELETLGKVYPRQSATSPDTWEGVYAVLSVCCTSYACTHAAVSLGHLGKVSTQCKCTYGSELGTLGEDVYAVVSVLTAVNPGTWEGVYAVLSACCNNYNACTHAVVSLRHLGKVSTPC